MYKEKYLKYKTKYTILRDKLQQKGGCFGFIPPTNESHNFHENDIACLNHGEGQICVICQENLSIDRRLFKTECGHIYHSECFILLYNTGINACTICSTPLGNNYYYNTVSHNPPFSDPYDVNTTRWMIETYNNIGDEPISESGNEEEDYADDPLNDRPDDMPVGFPENNEWNYAWNYATERSWGAGYKRFMIWLFEQGLIDRVNPSTSTIDVLSSFLGAVFDVPNLDDGYDMSQNYETITGDHRLLANNWVTLWGFNRVSPNRNDNIENFIVNLPAESRGIGRWADILAYFRINGIP